MVHHQNPACSVLVLVVLIMGARFCAAEPTDAILRPAPPITCSPSETLQVAQARGTCFWQPGQPADAALIPQLQQCLRGKSVYIVGTSVSRNWFFKLRQLMTANGTSPWVRSPGGANYRARQKVACGGGSEASRDSCRHEGIAFRWQNQNIHDAELTAALLGGGYDVVVANMGLGNIVHHPGTWATRLMQQGTQLAGLVSALPSSTRFYWRTTTHICPHGRCRPDDGFKGCGVPAEANAMIDISNVVLRHLLLQRDPRVQVLDVLPLTSCRFFDDHVHHAHLTIDHLLVFIARECPQLAVPIVKVCPHLCSTLLGREG